MYKDGLTKEPIDELVLKIDTTNTASHKVTELVGYEQVDSTTFKRGRSK